MPIMILAGEEEFLIARRVAELKEQLLDSAWQSLNLQTIDSPSLPSVIEAAHSIPFGPGKRVVLLNRCDLFTKRRSKDGSNEQASDKLQKEILEELDEALSSVVPDTYLLFSCPYNFDSTLRTSKIASKYGQLENYPKPKYYAGSRNAQLEAWCRKEAARFGATISDDAVGYLLASTEANLRQISSEMEKASIYIFPEKKITLKTVSHLSPYHWHVFSLIDHWVFNRKKEALTALDELLSRQSGMQILATLQTTLSKWINLKACAEELAFAGRQHKILQPGEMAKRVANQLGLKPFLVELDLRRIQSFSLSQLADMRLLLTDLEDQAKQGRMSDRQALTMFLSSG